MSSKDTRTVFSKKKLVWQNLNYFLKSLNCLCSSPFICRARIKSLVSNAVDDVAVVEKDFSLQKTISNIEGRLLRGDADHFVDEDDDILPAVATEMGAGMIPHCLLI